MNSSKPHQCARILPSVLMSAVVWFLSVFAPPVFSVVNEWSGKTLVVGVLAHRSISETAERWQPLARYLEGQLDGVSVRVEALTHAQINEAVDRQSLDLVLTNPSHFIELSQRNPLSGAVLTLIPLANQTPMSSFGGVMITRADNPDVLELRQLARNPVAAVNPSSLGGYQAQMAMLREMQLPLPEVTFLGLSHDALVQAVLEGRYAVGFVRSGVVEALIEEGRLQPDVIRVLNRQNLPGYPHAVSTRLYPEWPLFAAPHVDATLVRRVAAALLMLEPDSPVSRRVGIHGFTVPADYRVVERLLRDMRLPPFDHSVEVSWSDIWAQYAAWLIAILILSAVFALGGFRIFVLGRRAQDANRRFNELFRIVPAPIVLLEDNVITDCNHAAFQLLGYADKKSIIGSNLLDLSADVQADGVPSALALGRVDQALKQGQPQSFDWSFVGSNACHRQMDVTLLPMSSSQGNLVLGVWHDITERHRQHQLLASELALFSEGPVIVFEWGASSGWPVRSVSSNVTPELGYTPEELTSPGFSYTDLLHPDDIDRVMRESIACASSGRPTWIMSYRLRRKSGGYVWYSDHTQAVRDENNTLLATRGYLIDQSETKRLELQLTQERRSLYNILWGTGVGTWEWNVQTGEVRINERWAELIGYRVDELTPISFETWLRYLHPDDRRESEAALEDHFNGLSEHYECEVRMRHRCGDWVWVLSRGKVVERTGSGDPLWVAGTHLDITVRKRHEEQHRTLIDALSEAGVMLMVVDRDEVVRYMNRCMMQQFGNQQGVSTADLFGELIPESVSNDDSSLPVSVLKRRYRRHPGNGRVFDAIVVPYTDLAGKLCRLEVIRDVTVEHRQRVQLEHIAYHDALTGLANRPLFMDRLQQAVVDARRRRQMMAVAYLDLDGFKEVNDGYGHAAGDALLISLAQSMEKSLRESDTVARLGGDEFAVVLRDLLSHDVAMFLLRRVLKVASTPVELGHQHIQVSASIGVCFLVPELDADSGPEQLLRRADRAMYEAKTAGKNQIRVFGEQSPTSLLN